MEEGGGIEEGEVKEEEKKEEKEEKIEEQVDEEEAPNKREQANIFPFWKWKRNIKHSGTW